MKVDISKEILLLAKMAVDEKMMTDAQRFDGNYGSEWDVVAERLTAAIQKGKDESATE